MLTAIRYQCLLGASWWCKSQMDGDLAHAMIIPHWQAKI